MKSKNSKELEEFEQKVNNQDMNAQIKYRIDRSLEASVKYEYLIETYGEEKVDELVKDVIDLYDVDFYNSVKKKLESGSNV
jgi:hypothetical protein